MFQMSADQGEDDNSIQTDEIKQSSKYYYYFFDFSI